LLLYTKFILEITYILKITEGALILTGYYPSFKCQGAQRYHGTITKVQTPSLHNILGIYNSPNINMTFKIKQRKKSILKTSKSSWSCKSWNYRAAEISLETIKSRHYCFHSWVTGKIQWSCGQECERSLQYVNQGGLLHSPNLFYSFIGWKQQGSQKKKGGVLLANFFFCRTGYSCSHWVVFFYSHKGSTPDGHVRILENQDAK
jgi:hypothetical protein